jgi:hypothetical protein
MSSSSEKANVVWQSLEVGGKLPPDMASIGRRYTAFERTIQARNWREVIAGGAVIALALYSAWHTDRALSQAGYVVTALGVTFVLWQLWRRGRVDSALPGLPFIVHHSAQLRKQSAALKGVATWYLAPLQPGTVLFAIASVLYSPHEGARKFVSAAIVLAVTVVICALVLHLNLRAARKLDAEAGELEALG